MSNPTLNLNLFIDLKTQDKLRKWFSERNSLNGLVLTGLSLGDSDVDYKLSQQFYNIKTLAAPYEVSEIKHKLVYDGQINNLIGILTTYLRRVNPDGTVDSLYYYINGNSSNISFNPGTAPPVLANGYDWPTIPFTITENDREGFILFPQTLPDGYYDTNGNKLRLKETYDFDISVIPAGWEIIIDDVNGSLLIAKPTGYTFLTLFGQIKISGRDSGITKTINFNY